MAGGPVRGRMSGRLAVGVVVAAALLLAAACGGNGRSQGGVSVDQDSSTPWGLSVARATAKWAANGDIVANVNIDGGPTRLHFSLWDGDTQVWCCFDLKPETAPEPRLANFATMVNLPHELKASLDLKAHYRLQVDAFRQDTSLANMDAEVAGPVPQIDPNW